MRGITARLGKGFFDPVASPTKESLRALLWNLQSRGFPSPCTLDLDATMTRISGMATSQPMGFRFNAQPH